MRPRRREPLTPARQAIAAAYVPLVRRLARPFRLAWPKHRDDLDSAALCALVQAAADFDARVGATFPTFLRFRVYGAIRDELRRIGRHDAPPAQADGYRYHPGRDELARLMLASPVEPPSRAVDSADEVDGWLRSLPPIHAAACRALYLEGTTQQDHADGVGLSKSRVSEVHREALAMLRQMPRVAAAAGRRGIPCSC